MNEGFRGWPHNDYASDDRKGGEGEDKNLDCAERLDSIIRSLQQEKTICEDIMTSKCQIRMFVNAPRAYAARKSANRVGNSKRKKATDFPSTTRPAKNRRATRGARLQSSTPSFAEEPSSGETTGLQSLAPRPASSAPVDTTHVSIDLAPEIGRAHV